MSVTLGAGSARATLALGKEEEGATFARDQSRPMVFTVDQTVAADLKKPADDYRDKEALRVQELQRGAPPHRAGRRDLRVPEGRRHRREPGG